jgi:hypothetical protein
LVALTGCVGLALIGWARRRAKLHFPIREAVSSRPIADLEAGRFRLSGQVVPIQTSESAIDGSPCVYLEQAEYRRVGSGLVPLLREVEHRIHAHLFYLEDGSGRLLIDPRDAAIEAVTLFEEHGLIAERRLRAGEQVELVATFQRRQVEADGGPYRASALAWEPVEDACGPAQITYRTEPDMVVPADDVTSLLRGVGAMLMMISAVFGFLALI